MGAGRPENCGQYRQVDTNKYELKRKVIEDEFSKIQLFPCDILGNWNYVIKPRK